MAWAEFEEKEYESAALGELMREGASGRGFAFIAGQVLEKVVGYDAVAAPGGDHVVWRILQLPRPNGVRLLPSQWAPGPSPRVEELPQTPVTLIVQFKRPEYLYGATARQWRFWQQPYYRFERQVQQQRVLSRLERNADGDALVRYAAPAFWQRGQLEAAHLRGDVIDRSGFVSPRRLARHRWWTYLSPGINGRANPAGAPSRFESRSDLFSALSDQPQSSTELAPREGLGEHVLRVGAAARRAARPSLRQRVERWEKDLREREPDLERDSPPPRCNRNG